MSYHYTMDPMSMGIKTLAWTLLRCASLGIIQLMLSQFSPSFH